MANSPLGRISNFLGELKRRRVYRVTAIYVVLSVGGLELASVLLPSTRLPGWFDELFLGLAITGLPLVLVLAWTFDITESGIRGTTDLPKGSPGADDDLSRVGSPPAARERHGEASKSVVAATIGAASGTGGPPRRTSGSFSAGAPVTAVMTPKSTGPRMEPVFPPRASPTPSSDSCPRGMRRARKLMLHPSRARRARRPGPGIPAQP